jgi:hypothetical protein
MATIEQFQERLRRAVRESLQKCLAEGDLPEAEEGEARFTMIETLALAADDAISLEPEFGLTLRQEKRYSPQLVSGKDAKLERIPWIGKRYFVAWTTFVGGRNLFGDSGC